MYWDAIAAIATSLTVVLGMMLYLLNKPKIKLISASPIHWFYHYFKDEITGAALTITLKLKNEGGENSSVETKFISGERIFEADSFELAGKGKTFYGTISFILKEGSLPLKNEPLAGRLILEPWGNRTFLIGNKFINKELVFPPEKEGIN